VRLTLSPEILEEYTRVGEELAAAYEGIDPFPVLKLVAMHAEFVEAPLFEERVRDDPHDDKFLACALVARAKTIVSGDRHLLSVSGRQGVEVLRPRAFVDTHLR
jgi:predicted nucleic acid-binding protein